MVNGLRASPSDDPRSSHPKGLRSTGERQTLDGHSRHGDRRVFLRHRFARRASCLFCRQLLNRRRADPGSESRALRYIGAMDKTWFANWGDFIRRLRSGPPRDDRHQGSRWLSTTSLRMEDGVPDDDCIFDGIPRSTTPLRHGVCSKTAVSPLHQGQKCSLAGPLQLGIRSIVLWVQDT